MASEICCLGMLPNALSIPGLCPFLASPLQFAACGVVLCLTSNPLAERCIWVWCIWVWCSLKPAARRCGRRCGVVKG